MYICIKAIVVVLFGLPLKLFCAEAHLHCLKTGEISANIKFSSGTNAIRIWESVLLMRNRPHYFLSQTEINATEVHPTTFMVCVYRIDTVYVRQARPHYVYLRSSNKHIPIQAGRRSRTHVSETVSAHIYYVN